MNFSLEGQNLTSFLLAGRSLGFFTVATSLFSADIGAGHFIGIFDCSWLRQPQFKKIPTVTLKPFFVRGKDLVWLSYPCACVFFIL